MDYISLVDTDTLLNSRVFDKMGEDHGKVKELIIDPQSGQIVLVVLSSGGMMGVGATDRILPWEAMQMNPNTNDFVLVVNKDTLASSPVLERSDLGDRTALKQLYDYYGLPAYWDQHVATQSSDPTYMNEEDTSHQSYAGSHQVAHDTLAHNPNDKLSEELNYDKVRGEGSGQ
jgi:sporulation protein YlmC with PRC-barrel domain